MCSAFILVGHGLVSDLDANHLDSTGHLDSTNAAVSHHNHTGNLLPHGKGSNIGTSSNMTSKRRASSANHDEERPSKMGKTADSSASCKPQELACGTAGKMASAGANESDEALVASSDGGDPGKSKIESQGKNAGGEVGSVTSPLTSSEIDSLKKHIGEQDVYYKAVIAELEEAKAKIKRLEDSGCSLRDRYNATHSALVDTELVVDGLREELFDLRAQNVDLRNQSGGSSGSGKARSGSATTSLKEQVKEVESKSKEQWSKMMKKISDDHVAKINKLKKEHKQQLERRESTWSERADKLKEKHADQENKIKSDCEKKKNEWRDLFKQRLGEARTGKDQAIESEKEAKKKFAEDLKALKAEQQAEIKKHMPDTADAVKDLKAQLSESNHKVERLRSAAREQKDLAVKALAEVQDQKALVAIATDLVKQAREEKDVLKEELANREQAYQDLAFHKQKAADWKMRAEGHQRGVHGLNMALQSRDRALQGIRTELAAAVEENERLKQHEKRLMGGLATALDEVRT